MKLKGKAYKFRYEGSDYVHGGRTEAGVWVERKSLCSFATRQAFDLDYKAVEFVVTNKKPKSLTGWHILKKEKPYWVIRSSAEKWVIPGFVGTMLSDDFPKNTTLYVCAYQEERSGN